MVAGQHEDVVFGVEVLEGARGEGDADGIAGAALDALFDELDRHFGDKLILERLDHPLCAVTDHDHDAFQHLELGQRVDDVQDHGTAAQLVQDLRRPGTDPRALPGGQHNSGERTVLAHGDSIMLGRRTLHVVCIGAR